MHHQKKEIIDAISRELEFTGRQRHFRVVDVTAQQNTIRIEVAQTMDGGRLDHTLEGGTAGWGNLTSPVVTVSIDESLIYVYPLHKATLKKGSILRINPPRFLDALLECWKDDELAGASFSWAAHAMIGRQSSGLQLSPTFPELRARQKAAYALIGYRAGFLWGPPGTGKTRTAASIAADLAMKDPASKILLIAPTNAAVDQLLLAVDDSLASCVKGQAIRQQCARLGSNFTAGSYTKRPHLLPQATNELLLQKAQLEAAQPDPEEPDAFARWKREMEGLLAALRSQFLSILTQRRIVAMTATLASMHFGELRRHSPFTQLVFDEASQLNRATGLMLAHLAKQVLIAGDPRQLPPIHGASHSVVEKWLGRTLFDEYMHERHPSTCFLNEQSRMAEPICNVVSSAFYGGELTVSADSLTDPIWLHERRGLSLAGSEAKNVHIVNIDSEAVQHSGSQKRIESAEVAVRFARELANQVGASSVLILTPYVAQRTLIKEKLKSAGLKTVRVATVHAAQGSERCCIIFDPVKGDSWFLRKSVTGPRVINVAISRARACLILLLSAGDRAHPMLNSIANNAQSDSAFHLAFSTK